MSTDILLAVLIVLNAALLFRSYQTHSTPHPQSTRTASSQDISDEAFKNFAAADKEQAAAFSNALRNLNNFMTDMEVEDVREQER